MSDEARKYGDVALIKVKEFLFPDIKCKKGAALSKRPPL